MNTDLESYIKSKKVALVLGAGGVGKTTSSVLLALGAARAGKRVALLSIDPAKRMADALGIRLGAELTPVDLTGFGADFSGSLSAAMLDQKAVFDSMVHRFSPRPEIEKKILAHPIYRAVADKFGGAIEYMALAKLQQIIADKHYDLVVVDTPPDAHAMDFLIRPNLLANFMENKVLQWVLKPFAMAQKMGLGKLMAFGEKLAGGIAEVTGVVALQTLAEFMVLMQEVLAGFHRAGEEIVKILRDQSTGFILVCTAKQASARAAYNILGQITELGFTPGLVLMNRILPDALVQELSVDPTNDAASFAEPEVQSSLVLARKALMEREVLAQMRAHMRAKKLDRLPLAYVQEDFRDTLVSASGLGKKSTELLRAKFSYP